MRWRFDNVKEGDVRIITKFLWLPKRLGNECRWLERTRIVQKCVTKKDPVTLMLDWYLGWEDYGWA